MDGGLVVTTAPVTDPITLTEAKAFARIDTSADDPLVTDLITAARVYAEAILNRTFVDTTYTWFLDCFPPDGGPLLFPQPALSKVNTIKYVDTSGTQQTWSSDLYDEDIKSLVGRVLPSFGQSYPAARLEMNAIETEFIGGDGNQAQQAEDTKLLMKILVAESYEKRLHSTDRRVHLNQAAESLLWEMRVMAA